MTHTSSWRSRGAKGHPGSQHAFQFLRRQKRLAAGTESQGKMLETAENRACSVTEQHSINMENECGRGRLLRKQSERVLMALVSAVFIDAAALSAQTVWRPSLSAQQNIRLLEEGEETRAVIFFCVLSQFLSRVCRCWPTAAGKPSGKVTVVQLSTSLVRASAALTACKRVGVSRLRADLGASHGDSLAVRPEERLCPRGRWRQHFSQWGGLLLRVQPGGFACMSLLGFATRGCCRPKLWPDRSYQKDAGPWKNEWNDWKGLPQLCYSLLRSTTWTAPLPWATWWSAGRGPWWETRTQTWSSSAAFRIWTPHTRITPATQEVSH